MATAAANGNRLSIIIPVLLFADLTNIYIILMLIATFWLGLIGFIDDYKKVVEGNSAGISARTKIIGQTSVALAVGLLIYFAPNFDRELSVPFFKDFRVMLERYSFLKMKVGQWKAHYNRERVISSGKQQLVDRSLINRAFTLDRQVGLSLYGRLKGVGLADFNYWAVKGD